MCADKITKESTYELNNNQHLLTYQIKTKSNEREYIPVLTMSMLVQLIYQPTVRQGRYQGHSSSQ